MKTLRKYLAVLFPYRTRLEMRISMSSLLARVVSGKRNIVMFHIGRCGSTVLANALAQHSKINSQLEIFHELTPWIENGKINYRVKDIVLLHKLDWRFRSTLLEIKFASYEDLDRIGMPIEHLIEVLKEAGFNHFIILERHNKLLQQVSATQGKIRNKFHYRLEEKVPKFQVELEPRALKERIELLEHEYAQLRELLKGENTLEISYEDGVLQDLRGTYERICHWLGIIPQNYRTLTKRTNTEPVSKSVSNYDEIVQVLKDTKYDWMLERAHTD